MLFADQAIPVVESTGAWIPVVTAIAVTMGFIAQIWLQVMAKMEAAKVAAQLKADAEMVAKTANLAAQEAKAVKDALAQATSSTDTKLDNLTEVANLTHDCVNSASIIQLKLYAKAIKRLAEQSKEPEDVKEAEMVAEELQERLAAQAAAKK